MIEWCLPYPDRIWNIVPFSLKTRVALNAEIPSATYINICTQGWDCETVVNVKHSRCSRLSWWLYGGYVFQVVVKPKMLTFKNRFDLEDQGQSSYKTIKILTDAFCTSGRSKGQGQSPHKTIGILTKLFCTFGPNLIILAWMGPELSRRQANDWHTDWHRHTQTKAMTIPEGQNWPGVKMVIFSLIRPQLST